MQTEKVLFTQERETLLLTLYGKALDPRLHLLKEYQTTELVAYTRMSLPMRALVQAMNLFPTLRRMNRVLHYQF
jgi:hypothetical protein